MNFRGLQPVERGRGRWEIVSTWQECDQCRSGCIVFRLIFSHTKYNISRIGTIQLHRLSTCFVQRNHNLKSIDFTPVDHALGELDQGSIRIPRMDSSPLGTLPPELIFRILDLMIPFRYSGFSCVCRRALSLVNQKLDTPKHRKLTSLEFRKSHTAAFVAILRLVLDGKLAWVNDKLGSENVAICYGSELDENDSDL
jgi:hypothetical protein